MRTNRLFLGVFLIATLVAACCTSPSADSERLTIVNGAGASFPNPIYTKWFDEYHRRFPNIQINYQSIGSGGGIRQLQEGTVDFGATDGPMTDEQLAQAPGKIVHFPTVLGADVPVYNIPEVTAELNFTPENLADIFLGKITKWNDPELKKTNPTVNLPDKDLVVVHRSDSSGTTFVWVDYLSKVSPEWKTKVGVSTSVNWPVGLGGKGNEGVAGLIKATPYSIGYLELVYAIQNEMPYGRVRNSEGNFVKADLASVTAAAASVAANMPADFRVSITNAQGKDSYPISSFTWLLVPTNISDPAKKKAIRDFVDWMLNDGQGMVEELSYARVPKEVVEMEKRVLAGME